jgi:alkanesulfonate monooxygenase SsuD/methylene tetrahydromethanopterin reductase-like flavin-dependent oxidoreductase (luciferase family)
VTQRRRRTRVHLAVALPRGQVDIESLAHLARTAERALFDFVLLADASQPLPLLAALAAVTERLGLVGAVDTASQQPFEVARQFATLDHLSDGRAGWYATGTDYRRADEFLAVVDALWGSWEPGAVVADVDADVYAQPDRIRVIEHHGEFFDIRGAATLPAGPQGRPVLVHAAETLADVDFGARHADIVVTPHHAAVGACATAHGRNPDDVLVFGPVALGAGDTTADIERLVQSDTCDGLVLVPSPGPRGLDDVDGLFGEVVPLLQKSGLVRDQYDGFTLREHLGL